MARYGAAHAPGTIPIRRKSSWAWTFLFGELQTGPSLRPGPEPLLGPDPGPSPGPQPGPGS